MPNSSSKDGTDAATVTDVQVTTSSQTIAKPNVSCRIIKGCSDCPMCDMLDMTSGYACKLVDSQKFGYIKEKRWMPVTPDWCPIKAEPLLLKYGS